MNLPHLHLLLNHFPTVGMIAALGVFLAGLLMKSADVKRVGLGAFVAVALLSIPAFVTGTAAQLALAEVPGVSTPRIETHEDAAFIALWFMEFTGAMAWFGLWQCRRAARFQQTTLAAVLLMGLATFGLMSRAATLGGEIRHPEIRAGESAAEPAPSGLTVTRQIGFVMSELKWYWPASEALHFLGLCLLFGVVLVVDLRMLGFMKAIPFSALHRLLPWGVLGFGVNVATGMLFFVGAPPNFYVTSAVFFWKLVLILVAGANAMYFTVFDDAWLVGPGDTPSASAKIAALSGILLWFGVIFCGQMLPFIGRSF